VFELENERSEGEGVKLGERAFKLSGRIYVLVLLA
jgi:hypothetical protein